LRLSDQPMGLTPQARHFLRRNRLIAGLSAAVVVVEAPVRSGALSTARAALDAAREVLAVPGHPMRSRVSGCNQLIRDGATLVRSAADVLAVLGSPLPVPARSVDLGTPPVDPRGAAPRPDYSPPRRPEPQRLTAGQTRPSSPASAQN